MPRLFCWLRRSAYADLRSRCRSRGRAPAPRQVSAPVRPRRSLAAELEQTLGHSADLDLFGALGDPVATVVAVDVLERLVAAVAEAARDLHPTIGRVAHPPGGAIVGHPPLFRPFPSGGSVLVPRRLL